MQSPCGRHVRLQFDACDQTSGAGAIAQRYAAADPLGDGPDDGEAETSALTIFGVAREALEYAAEHILRQTRAGVANLHRDGVPTWLDPDLDPSACRGIAHRIVDKVGE